MIGPSEFPEWVYVDASFFALLYLICFVVTRYIVVSGWGLASIWSGLFEALRDWGAPKNSWIIPACLLASILFFLTGLGIYSVNAAFSINWWDLVHSGSPLVLLATYTAYSASCLLILVHLWRKDFPRAFYISAGLSVFFLVFSVFVLKTRSYALMLLVPYFYFVLCGKGKSGFVGLLFLSVGTAFVFVLTRAVRHAEDLNQFLSFGLSYFWGDAASGVETDFVKAFYFFVYKGDAFVGFGENITLQRVLLFWLPSFGDWVKPPDFSYVMHSAYYGSALEDSLSMHPTVFGDAFGNAGYVGALTYSTLLALYFSGVEYLVKASRSYLLKLSAFSLMCVCALIFARGAIYNAFMFSLLPLILVAAAIIFASLFGRLRLR